MRTLQLLSILRSPSPSLLLAGFFFAGLETAIALQQWIWFLIAFFLGITTIGIFFIRATEQNEFHASQTILPLLAAAGSTGFSLFLPVSGSIHIFFTLSAILFYSILRLAALQAYPTWNMLASIAVLYLCLAATLGWRYVLYPPVVLVLAISAVMIFLISYQFLLRYEVRRFQSALQALSLAFILSETLWTLQFTSFHFMVQAGIIVTLYYGATQLLAHDTEHILDKRKLREYMMIVCIAIMLLLISAKWL